MLQLQPLQRLVALQASLEEKSRWQKRPQFWEQGEATFREVPLHTYTPTHPRGSSPTRLHTLGEFPLHTYTPTHPSGSSPTHQ